ncbi:MAG: Crp/Fnr family transcriptional regulator [Pseudomonadales bacterium]|nr:Crp/Fnr family transcriptional regulator [Pseudomonadales bacterium]
MADFIAFFSGRTDGFDAADFEKFGLQVEHKHFKKGEFLIRQGDPAPKLFFLSTGLVRFMSISVDGKEFTQSFATAPGISGSTRAMTMETEALFSIEVLEDVVCLQIDWKIFIEKMQAEPGFLQAYNGLLEWMFIKKEEREYSLLQQSAEQRYLNFIHNNPQLQDKVSLKIIASYIGITAIALSRIRKQLK